MQNEIVLITSLVVIYLLAILFYKFFGKTGLYVWIAIATIAANIEVMILVDAFGMNQTLGNILFASTFLVTDILSEHEGKKAARKAALVGIATSIVFIVITNSWFLYLPSENDVMLPVIQQVFTNTPRIMIAGLVVYGVVQFFDVWFYDFIWLFTKRIFKSESKGLWIRNNASTLISQLLNAFLFTFLAFYNVHSMDVLLSIFASTYVIYVFTSILDTPFVYLVKKLKEKS